MDYKKKAKRKMDDYVHLIYQLARAFPREELYGVTSQLRRSSLSVILNYIEGFARRRPKVQLNFLETSYGSLRESKYLLHFACRENFIALKKYEKGLKMAEEIGAILWTEIKFLEKSIKSKKYYK